MQQAPRQPSSGPPYTINGQPAVFSTGTVLRQAINQTNAQVAGAVNAPQYIPDNDGTSPLVVTLDAPNPELYYQADFGFIWDSPTTNPDVDPLKLQYSIDGGANWIDENKSMLSGRSYKGTGPFTAQTQLRTAALKGSALGVSATTASLKFRLYASISSAWVCWPQRFGMLSELAP